MAHINALRLVLGSKDSFLEINVPKSIGKEIIQEWREVMLSIPFSPLFLFLWINSRKKKTHATAYTKLWCFNTYVYIIRCDPKKFEVNWFFILPYNCLDIKKKKKSKLESDYNKLSIKQRQQFFILKLSIVIIRMKDLNHVLFFVENIIMY